MLYWGRVMYMEILLCILLAALCLGLPLFIVLKTQQSRKRGCGRGCATCRNRDFCHRSALRDKKR